MSHPYKLYGHKNDPQWVGGLNKYIEKAKEGDVKQVVRQYAADPGPTAKAAYTPTTGKGKGK